MEQETKKKTSKFKIWFRANFLDWPYWRVAYDGKRTIPLYKAEAKGLRDFFKGKMYIDYDLNY